MAGTSLDALAGASQYVSHLLPVWARVPDRGTFWVTDDSLRALVEEQLPGSDVRVIGAHELPRPVLVASHADLARTRRRRAPRVAYMEHGAGQSYPGDRRWARHVAYAGGAGRERCGLILAPNRHAAARWEQAYPAVPVHVIGATRVLPPPAGAPLLVVSFHWPGPIPELTSALSQYPLSALASLPVAVHAHPRYARSVSRAAARAGLPFIDSLEEVARRATVYAVDNSSTLWEMGLSRPVISLNAPAYRRNVTHGLRFWSHALAQVDDVDDLVRKAARYLEGGERDAERRERESVCRDVIPHLDGAERGSRLLSRWATLSP